MSYGLLSGLRLNSPKRKIFVSYHHVNDVGYYNEFSRFFSDTYDVIQDNSVDRDIDSTNSDYVIRCIRENYITGTSCTIVLCGSQTPWRKFVDWEIKATLDKEHGLIGVNLPSNPLSKNNLYTVPDRLHDNIVTGYALWLNWSELNGGEAFLRGKIEEANSKQKIIIDNSRLLKNRNG
jgi:hypothetical protein